MLDMVSWSEYYVLASCPAVATPWYCSNAFVVFLYNGVVEVAPGPMSRCMMPFCQIVRS
jgi:hypothetical protein